MALVYSIYLVKLLVTLAVKSKQVWQFFPSFKTDLAENDSILSDTVVLWQGTTILIKCTPCIVTVFLSPDSVFLCTPLTIYRFPMGVIVF